MAKCRVGLCAWNFWGDGTVDRPDNTDELVVSYFVNWLLDKGLCDRIYQLQHMDKIAPVFNAEVAALRKKACLSLVHIGPRDKMPDLDLIFCRWRWDLGATNDPRLAAQRRMLDHYGNTRTRILIWDEDFKLSPDERESLTATDNVTLIETSESAREGDSEGLVYVPHPIALDDSGLDRVLGRPGNREGDHIDWMLRVAYVGNNYEREEYLTKYLRFAANMDPGTVHLYGNWMKYNTEILERHPSMVFHTKVGRRMRDWIYQHAGTVPMLAKDVYFERGHITPRLHEVVMAGGIPIGFHEFKGWKRYYNPEFVVRDSKEFGILAAEVFLYDKEKRRQALKMQLEILHDNRVFDVDHFFECIGVD